MVHTYDAKAFGPGATKRGEFHVVHTGSETTVGAFTTEGSAKDDCEDRNTRAKALGIEGRYEVRPESEGTAVKAAV